MTAVTENNDDKSLVHRTQVLKYLVKPWARTNCVVFIDSFLHLYRVQGALSNGSQVYWHGQGSNKRFSYAQLSLKQFEGKGEWFGYYHDGDDTPMDPGINSPENQNTQGVVDLQQ